MRAVAISFYGHSFSLDYKPPNISPFRPVVGGTKKIVSKREKLYISAKPKLSDFNLGFILCYKELSPT